MKTFNLLICLLISILSFHVNAETIAVANGIHINSKSNALIPLILSAQKNIKIEIYTMTDPNVRKALRMKLAKKVKIQIVKDPTPLGDKCDVFSPPNTGQDTSDDCNDQKKFVAEVRASGGNYVPFNKEVLCGNGSKDCFEHGKLIIIDNNTAMISTGNYDPSNLCDSAADPDRCNRDYSFVIRDPNAVSLFIEIFMNDLTGKPYDLTAVLAKHPNALVTVSPYALDQVMRLILSAKKYILIQNQYTNNPQINQALLAKAKQGVKVFVNIASFCSFTPPTPDQITRLTAQFTTFDQAGIQTRLFTDKQIIGSKPGYLHAKAIIVDGAAAWVGSNNFSSKSFNENREFGYFFNYKNWLMILQEQIKQDFLNPNTESWQESLKCTKDDPRRTPKPN